MDFIFTIALTAVFPEKVQKKQSINVFCLGCMRPIEFIRSKHDVATYIEMVESRCTRALESHSRYPEIVFETEISTNPLFNPELHEKAKQAEKHISDGIASAAINANKPKCPHCNSTNIKKISSLNRAVSVGFWGLASSKIGKQFECENCGYKW